MWKPIQQSDFRLRYLDWWCLLCLSLLACFSWISHCAFKRLIRSRPIPYHVNNGLSLLSVNSFWVVILWHIGFSSVQSVSMLQIKYLHLSGIKYVRLSSSRHSRLLILSINSFSVNFPENVLTLFIHISYMFNPIIYWYGYMNKSIMKEDFYPHWSYLSLLFPVIC